VIDKKVWDDQAEFNAQLRPLPTAYEDRVNLTKEFSLHMMTEVTEMLRACGIWEMHRTRHEEKYNPENVRRQLIDQFKYWMSIAQLWGFDVADMERSYWRKTATVRQRYVEEHIHHIHDQEIVVLDIDNVLADYTRGFGMWLSKNLHQYTFHTEAAAREKLQDAISRRLYMNETQLGIPHYAWAKIQHDFRISGAMAHMPPMPGAQAFVQGLHAQGLVVVALTSRPVEEYPNLHDDTVAWFKNNDIVMDYIWWGANKAEKLAQNLPMLPNIRFAIDDDIRYLQQYSRMGIKTIYWYMQGYDTDYDPRDTAVIPITGFHDIQGDVTP